MSFLEPQRLWLLVIVGALAVAYVAVLRWRRAATLRFTTVDLLDELQAAAQIGQTDHDDDGAHRQ